MAILQVRIDMPAGRCGLLILACTAALLTGCSPPPPADVDGVVEPIADGVAQLREDLIDLDEGRANAGAWRGGDLFGRIAAIALMSDLLDSADDAFDWEAVSQIMRKVATRDQRRPGRYAATQRKAAKESV